MRKNGFMRSSPRVGNRGLTPVEIGEALASHKDPQAPPLVNVILGLDVGAPDTHA